MWGAFKSPSHTEQALYESCEETHLVYVITAVPSCNLQAEAKQVEISGKKGKKFINADNYILIKLTMLINICINKINSFSSGFDW